MAERRMISRRIVESDKIRALANAGNYRACFLYTSLLAFYDSAGRMNANPMLLKGGLFEGYELTHEDIAASLHDLARVGLVRLYRNGRHEWIAQCEKFLVSQGGYNSPHPKEPKSDLPGPEDVGSASRDLPEDFRETSGKLPGNFPGEIEIEREIEREIEKEHTSAKTDLAIAEPWSAPPTRAIASRGPSIDETFLDAWNVHRGRLPAAEKLTDTRKRAFGKLRKDHGDEAIALLADAAAAVANDDFWVERGYGLDNLLRGKVVEKAEKWRANGAAKLGGANARLATQVDRWARALDEVN